MNKIKKGDTIKVIAGKEKGKIGTVLKVITANNSTSPTRVIVEGVNIVKKHQKPSAEDKGGILEKEASIHISNVAYFSNDEGVFAKIGIKKLEDGSKVRYLKKTGTTIV